MGVFSDVSDFIFGTKAKMTVTGDTGAIADFIEEAAQIADATSYLADTRF